METKQFVENKYKFYRKWMRKEPHIYLTNSDLIWAKHQI